MSVVPEWSEAPRGEHNAGAGRRLLGRPEVGRDKPGGSTGSTFRGRKLCSSHVCPPAGSGDDQGRPSFMPVFSIFAGSADLSSVLTPSVVMARDVVGLTFRERPPEKSGGWTSFGSDEPGRSGRGSRAALRFLRLRHLPATSVQFS